MSEDVTRVVHQEPPDDRGGRGDRGRDGSGHGWMLATVALVALLVGAGAGLLLSDGGDDPARTTVHRTVTAPAAEPVTLTQRSVTTIERTVTAPVETVTLTVPDVGETATDQDG